MLSSISSFYQTSGVLLCGTITKSFIMGSNYLYFTVEHLRAREPTNEREQGTDDNIYIKNEGIDGTQHQQSP